MKAKKDSKKKFQINEDESAWGGFLVDADAVAALTFFDRAREAVAHATLKAFSEDEQELCRRTFLRLTQPGEGTEDTKRRASMQELLSFSGKSAAEENIIQKLRR